jgi:thiol-disulfide isomerase/thioredoxin
MRLSPWLYTAALLLASPAAALPPAAVEALQAQRTGEMTRLVLHAEPRQRVDVPFDDAQGRPVTFADWQGQVVFVNFWATWCPPCLKEMPAINRLAAAMKGEVAVIAISTDRGSPDKPRRWLESNGIANLPLYHDKALRLANGSGILGQPTTLILDRQGREIARFQGDAEWDSPEAQAILRAIAAATAADG